MRGDARRIPALFRRGGRSPVVAGGGAWSPLRLTGLRGWYRADLGVTEVSGGVDVWADQSGNGNDQSAASSGARPTVVTGYNGSPHPAVRFNGTSQWLRNTTFSWGGTPGPLTIVLIGTRRSSAAVVNDYAVSYGAGNNPYVRSQSGERWDVRASTVAGVLTTSGETPVGEHAVLGLWWDAATKRAYVGYNISGSGIDAGTPTTDGQTLSIGAAVTGVASTMVEMDVAEVIVCRAALTDAEWLALATYAERYWSYTGAVDVLQLGQSNALGVSAATETIRMPRPDLFAARDTDISGTREQSVGTLSWTCTIGGNKQAFDATLADKLKRLSRRPRIITCAKSGAGFYNSGGTIDPDGWIPPSRNSGVGGTQYDRAVALINANKSAAADTTVLVWAHGETDGATVVGHSNYEANLTALLTDLEADTGLTIVPIIIRLHSSASVTYKTEIRAAQTAFVAGWSGASLLDVDAYTLSADLVHYSSAMHASIGADCATIIDGLLP